MVDGCHPELLFLILVAKPCGRGRGHLVESTKMCAPAIELRSFINAQLIVLPTLCLI